MVVKVLPCVVTRMTPSIIQRWTLSLREVGNFIELLNSRVRAGDKVLEEH